MKNLIPGPELAASFGDSVRASCAAKRDALSVGLLRRRLQLVRGRLDDRRRGDNDTTAGNADAVATGAGGHAFGSDANAGEDTHRNPHRDLVDPYFILGQEAPDWGRGGLGKPRVTQYG